MRGLGGSPLTLLFAALLLGGLLLLVFVGVRAILGGIDRPEQTPTGRSPSDGPRPSGPRSEARRILDERYARGDLTAAEYRECVETLSEGR